MGRSGMGRVGFGPSCPAPISNLCILGSFLRLNIQNGGYIFGLLKFQILFFFWGGGCLKFLIFLGGER